MRLLPVLVVTALLFGCGSDSSGPSHPFPNAAGAYAVDGGFDGFTRTDASVTGSLTLNQASQDTGTLTGAITLTLNVQGDVSTLSDEPILSASVTPSGVVSFRITGTGVSWTFTGTLSGKTITGRHTLTDGTSTLSGDWTGTRP
jgi:hypothetical protein